MRRGAVAAVLFGAGCATLAAAESFDPPTNKTRPYDEQGEFASRPISRANAAAQREVLESDPVDGGVAPGATQWQDPSVDWGDDHDGRCDSCGGWPMGGFIPRGFWGRADALTWWVRGSETPPLVTTSPNGTPTATAGVLPNAEILFGDQRLNATVRGGGRFTLGYWLDQYGVGLEDTFLFLGDPGQSFFATSNGSGLPILARPFFNTQTSAQDAFLLTFPGVRDGSVNIQSSSTIYANELNVRQALYADCCMRFDFLVGYRLFHMAEGLDINTNSTSLAGDAAPAGTKFAIRDTFNTQNQFNGGQVGFKLQEIHGRWIFDIVGKFAVGGVVQRAQVNGSTVTTEPGAQPVINAGGILALGSNIGPHQQTKIGYLPELGLNVGYQLTPLWKCNFGYTVMFMTNVARPGDQIDTRLDPAQFPPGQPSTLPAFAFHQSNIWLQGLNLGVEYSY